MVKLLIIADDFTGALDTGVQLAACGAATLITTGNMSLTGQDSDPDVLVLDAETRHLPPEKAYAAISEIAAKAGSLRIPHIFKKTDSALRGNIGAELTALLHACGESQLPFIPAFPQIGRTTENGVHLINGVAVENSVFHADPFEPVRHSRVSQIIADQNNVPVKNCPVPDEGTLFPSDPGILVFDSRTEADLHAIARTLKRTGHTHILAGCAGFGAVLPELLDLGSPRTPEIPVLDPRLLIICGSVNPITLAQLDDAENSGFARIRLTPAQKMGSGYWDTEEGIRDIGQLSRFLAENPLCMIDSNDKEGNDPTRKYAAEHHMDLNGMRLAISHSLGYIVKSLFSSAGLGTLLITGGDTLLQCMNCMGVNTLEPVCEFEPGVVLSKFSSGDSTHYILTKSGGFGNADLMSRIAERISVK